MVTPWRPRSSMSSGRPNPAPSTSPRDSWHRRRCAAGTSLVLGVEARAGRDLGTPHRPPALRGGRDQTRSPGRQRESSGVARRRPRRRSPPGRPPPRPPRAAVLCCSYAPVGQHRQPGCCRNRAKIRRRCRTTTGAAPARRGAMPPSAARRRLVPRVPQADDPCRQVSQGHQGVAGTTTGRGSCGHPTNREGQPNELSRMPPAGAAQAPSPSTATLPATDAAGIREPAAALAGGAGRRGWRRIR